MKFAQIIEMSTPRFDDVRQLDEEWKARTAGTRPPSVEFIAADRDRPHTFVAYVVWDSFEDAQKNNALPATHEISAKIAELCDEMTFHNLDVLDEQHDYSKRS
jgi:hypothetical protein